MPNPGRGILRAHMPGEGPGGAWVLGSLVAAVVFPVVMGGQTASPPQKIDPAWLMVDSSTKTATVKLIAGLTGLNGALNFNGFRDGGLTFTVPLGWNVVMRFSNNDGDLPHSAEVIADTNPLPFGPVDPAFDRAVTIRLAQGLEAGAEDDIRFVANKAGSFIIFCAVPGHGVAGMWIRFQVSKSAERPRIAATPAAGS